MRKSFYTSSNKRSTPQKYEVTIRYLKYFYETAIIMKHAENVQLLINFLNVGIY